MSVGRRWMCVANEYKKKEFKEYFWKVCLLFLEHNLFLLYWKDFQHSKLGHAFLIIIVPLCWSFLFDSRVWFGVTNGRLVSTSCVLLRSKSHVSNSEREGLQVSNKTGNWTFCSSLIRYVFLAHCMKFLKAFPGRLQWQHMLACTRMRMPTQSGQ